LLKASRYLGQRRDKQVTQTVPVQAVPPAKAVLEHLGEQGFVVGKGGDTVAKIPWRQHS